MAKSVKLKASAADDLLATYRKKRNFSRTAEPSGATGAQSGQRFVVQKHAASRLHYDFRLELDGVLVSWAVTRGPSLNPDDKRLAVRTEDHPLDYARFEGSIAKSEYGGGTVMLWDIGTWESVAGKDPSVTLQEGHLHFFLYGQRMRGEWLLVRLKPCGNEKRENWLLRKIDDQHAAGSDDLISNHITSIDTGRSMEEIAAGKRVRSPPKKSRTDVAHEASFPPFRPVQLATLADHVPSGDDWLHELKYDGYRVLISVGRDGGRAYTRSGLDWSDRFASLIADAAQFGATSALIDGEAVVLLPDGRTSFHALQAAIKGDRQAIAFYAFDLLELDGIDLTQLPLTARKDKLQALIGASSGRVRYSDHMIGMGETLFAHAYSSGLEGIISKRIDSKYKGVRTGDWVKTKCTQRQEFFIVGWTKSERKRGFASLLLGVNEAGSLRYVGKVGTGFTDQEMARLLSLMVPLAQAKPAVDAPKIALRGACWIKPKLVAEVAFAEFTGEGVLRHATYLGLRGDKRLKADTIKNEAPIGDVMAASATSGVKITNPDRIIFPEGNLSKGALADYYEAVAAIMLPWLGNRPMSLVRCPQGRAKKCFFQKHGAESFGDDVKQVAISDKDGRTEPYLFVDTPAGLLSCVQMGTIEFHGWGARIKDVEQPDRMVFDLDPDEALDFQTVISAAEHVRDLLANMGLVTFPMVTGGKGIHVIAPLTPSAQWPEVKDFARRFATAVAQADPDKFTAALLKAKRGGKIFIDYLRNQRGATAVMPYSARSREYAPIAVPVTWQELHKLKTPARWHIGDAAEMNKRAMSKDLAAWGRADQSLPEL